MRVRGGLGLNRIRSRGMPLSSGRLTRATQSHLATAFVRSPNSLPMAHSFYERLRAYHANAIQCAAGARRDAFKGAKSERGQCYVVMH
jgi:hypothetical protein